MNSTLVVAMDGTSGSGKSSTSRGVARALGLRYLDTGAQFRAITFWMLENDVDVDDATEVAARVGEPVLVSGTDPAHPTITLDGADVSGPIRGQRVTTAVSAVSVVPAVRTRLLELQRRIIADAHEQSGGIVVEGRDIGSVVWPQAAVKIYLTAEASARAERRATEDGAGEVGAVEADLRRRDAIDSGRAAAPLVRADGAVHLDSTPYTLEEVVAQVVALVERGQQTAEDSSEATG